MDSSRACRALKKNGRPCRAPALRAGSACFWHAPESTEAAAEAAAIAPPTSATARSVGVPSGPVHITKLNPATNETVRKPENIGCSQTPPTGVCSQTASPVRSSCNVVAAG